MNVCFGDINDSSDLVHPYVDVKMNNNTWSIKSNKFTTTCFDNHVLLQLIKFIFQIDRNTYKYTEDKQQAQNQISLTNELDPLV